MINTPRNPRADAAARGTPRARLRRVSAFTALAVAAVLGASCTDMESIDPQRDNGNPSIDLTPSTAPDSSIAFNVLAADQIGIKYVDITVTGGVTARFADTLRTTVTTFTRSYNVPVPPSVPPGTNVLVTAQATDGAGNRSAIDTLNMATGNVAAAGIVITSPMSGSQAVSGKSLVLSISARSPLKLRWVGYQVTGAFTAADSTSVATVPMRDSVLILDSLAVPANITGTATVTPFAIDSLNQRSLGASITLTVVSPTQVVTTPVINFRIAPRIEVQDVMYVEGTDLAGIKTLGYEMRDSAGAMVDRDSAMYDGSFTTVPQTFQLSLPVTTFPTRLFVRAFGTNTNNVRAYAGGTTIRTDTVLVVAGVTRPLPSGGVVADAYYHRRHDRLYLTNVTRNQVDVFNL
ncbi:MAG: hypothetical protein ICV72_15030, partial [Aldersonia sp.]|nr:hypothetical protein [Aldersonia sp.]